MLSIKDVIELLNKSNRTISTLQKKWQDVYYDISLHTTGACPKYKDERNEVWIKPTNWFGEQYDLRFKRQLMNRFPTEPESTRNWRLSQYFPLTKAPFQQIMEITIGAIFQDSNYSIIVDNPKDHEYIWGNNFEGKNLIQFFASKFQSICEDPNGFFVYVPRQSRIDSTDVIEPEIWFVYSKDIITYTNDEIIFFRPASDYVWHINRIGIFRYNKNINGQYINADGEDGYYAHLFGYIPVDVAGGQVNTQGFLDSWLDKARPIADEYIGAHSSSQLVDKEASHPIIQAASTDCPECESGSKVERCPNWLPDEDTHSCSICDLGYIRIKCGRCNGTGELAYTPGKWLTVPKDYADKDMIRIHDFDTAINQYHKDNNADIFKRLMEALFLYRSDKAESGAAKAIDQENKYNFISKISNDYFDRLITNAIKIITSYRNITVNNGDIKPTPATYTIIKPTQFQIKTAEDLLNEYDAASKANLPAFILAQHSLAYTDKQFGGDDVMKKKAEYIMQDDPFFIYTIEERKQLVGTAIDARGLQYSVMLPMLLDTVIRNKSKVWFVQAGYDDIKKEVDKVFKKVPPVKQEKRFTVKNEADPSINNQPPKQ